MLRTAKLTVRDEIKNGLEYYRYTFLGEIPKIDVNLEIYVNLEKQLELRFGKGTRIPPLLRVGSWIGGDREVLLAALQDGKPLLGEMKQYSAVAQSELRIMHAAAQIYQRLGRAALPNHIISNTDAVSDMLELTLMLQQADLCWKAAKIRYCIPISSRCSRPSKTCAAAVPSWTSCSRFRTTSNCWPAAATRRK